MFQGISIAFRTFAATILSPKSAPRTAMLFLLIAGVGIASFLGGGITRSQLEDIANWALFPGTPLLALALSGLPLRDGHGDKTLLYLVISPVSRGILAGVRTMATVLLSATILGFIVLITTLFTQQWSMGIARQIGAIALGSAFYIAFFGMVQLVFRRGLFAGLIFYFLLDVPLARLPAQLSMLSPSWHLRVLAGPTFTSEVARMGTFTPAPEISATVLLAGSALFGALILFFFTRKDLGDLC